MNDKFKAVAIMAGLFLLSILICFGAIIGTYAVVREKIAAGVVGGAAFALFINWVLFDRKPKK